jgi:hypothetical protein
MAEAARNNEVETSHAERVGRKPVMLYDSGHGTQVKQWPDSGKDGKYTNTVIERSYKTDEGWKTERVSLNQEELLAVGRALEQGHDRIVERQLQPRQSQSR